ncbi:MAG: VirB6/TrbL-like conjugal transfer protein, CD1112 family [Ruminococcus sp.]
MTWKSCSDTGGSFHIRFNESGWQATLTSMFNSQIDSMGIGELIGLGMETMIISLCMKIMSVLITVILYGRMIEIYLYVSVAPIPAANRNQ